MKKKLATVLGLLVALALAGGAWVLAVHSDWLKAAPEEEDTAEVMPIPTVRLGKVTRATLRRYVEGTGTVEAQPGLDGKPAAAARVASPVPGIVSEVPVEVGQRVEKGTLLFQLDDRLARSEEEKAQAAVATAAASLDKLKSTPRPEQLRVAEMQVERAGQSVEFSKKKRERLAQLVKSELASEKSLQEVELEAAGATNDLGIAEKQLLLLRSSPTREELAEVQGKLLEAEKALSGARVQRSLLQIRSPLAGTLVRLRGSAGEAVDLTTVLAEVVDLERLVVEGYVPSASLRRLAVGQAVDLVPGGENPHGPGALAPVRGKVTFVGLDVDRKADAGFVRVGLPPKSGLVPGQLVRLRIAVEEQKDHLAVPRESLVRTAEGKDVIVGFLGEKAVQKPVQTGIRDGDLVGIEGEEIDEGDPIVTQGAYGLPGEAKVRVEGTK